MGLLEWATSPWGQTVPIHIAWFLIWVSVIAGLLFLILHAIYVMYFAKPKEFANDASSAVPALPKHVPRHSLVARLFHWIMAASMFTLLFTAFLPKVGIQRSLDRLHPLSCHSCLLLAGFLVDLARQNRSGRCVEKSSPLFWNACATAAKVCQVSFGE